VRITALEAKSFRKAVVATPSRLNFLLPSVVDLFFLALLGGLSCSALAMRLLGDAGIGWHIRNGELMLRSHAVTRTDVFSSTMSGHAWYAWEWLYDIAIAAVHGWAGLNGVVFVTALVIAATFALALRWSLIRGTMLPLAVALTVLALAASAIHWLTRPHVVSWLLVVIWFEVLDAWETGGPAKDRSLLWLPALMLVWVNVHGGFVTGFILLAVYLVSGGIEYLAWERQAAAARRLRWLGVVTLLSLLASLVNPYGYKLHVHVYEYLGNRWLMEHIEEFKSPNFHGAAEQCFVALVVIAIIALAAARERPRVSQVMVLIFAVASGMYASRSLPVGGILLAMVAGVMATREINAAGKDARLAGWLRRWVLRGEAFAARMEGLELRARGHLWPALGVVLGLWICGHGGKLRARQIMNAQFDGARFPVQAVDWVEANGVREPIFCPDRWGGYLIYRLYPRTKVVVDDRHDLYGEEFFKNYLKVERAEPGWEIVLDEERVHWVMVPRGSALESALEESAGWKARYGDGVAEVFQR